MHPPRRGGLALAEELAEQAPGGLMDALSPPRPDPEAN